MRTFKQLRFLFFLHVVVVAMSQRSKAAMYVVRRNEKFFRQLTSTARTLIKGVGVGGGVEWTRTGYGNVPTYFPVEPVRIDT